MLNRLVRRAVLTEADRVVGPDEGHPDLLDRGEPRGGAHVVGEHQEGAAVGPGEAGQGDAVEDQAHPELADAEVEGAPIGSAAPLARLLLTRDEGRLALHGRVVGLRQVGRAAPQLRHDASQRTEHLARRRPRCQPLGVGREARHRLGEPSGQLPGDEPVEEGGAVGVGLAPRLVALVPLLVRRLAARLHLADVRDQLSGDLEVLLRVEAEELLQPSNLGVTEGGAVRLAGVLLGRGRPRDDRAQDDEGRLAGRAALLAGRQQRIDVLDVGLAVAVATPVDGLDIPAVGLVALAHVLGERNLRLVLDGDGVLVVDHREVAEFLVPRQGAGLMGDAFHDVAVGGDHPDVVVERAGALCGVGVKQAPDAALRERHPNRRGEPRPERARRDLDTRGVVNLRVPRRERSPRAQGLEVRQLQAVAREVELDVLRQRGVAAGQNEAVPAEPLGVGGVVLHDVLIEQVCRGRQTHGRARVAIAHLLHRIRGQDPDRVDGADVEVAPPGLLGLGGRDRAGRCRGGPAAGPLGWGWCGDVGHGYLFGAGERLQAYPIQPTGRVTHVACCPPIDSGRRQFPRAPSRPSGNAS